MCGIHLEYTRRMPLVVESHTHLATMTTSVVRLSNWQPYHYHHQFVNTVISSISIERSLIEML
jgi:hypothetical protein